MPAWKLAVGSGEFWDLARADIAAARHRVLIQAMTWEGDAAGLPVAQAIGGSNVADRRGNAMFLGPDLYWDDLMLQAAPTGGRFISAEKVVDTDKLAGHGTLHQMRISRMMVDGVVEAPGGAHFTLCDPEYARDEAVQRDYAASAKSPEAWAEFRANWVDIGEDEYQRKVQEART